MANKLTKSFAYTWVPGTNGVSANPGSPAAPARTIYRTQEHLIRAFFAAGDSPMYQPYAGTGTVVSTPYGAAVEIFRGNITEYWLIAGNRATRNTRTGAYYINGKRVVSGHTAELTQSADAGLQWSDEEGGYTGISYQAVPHLKVSWLTTEVEVIPGTPAVPPTLAIPPTPAYYQTEFQIGWNATARSIKAVQGGVHASFRANRGLTGAVVGLAQPTTTETGYADIEHGFYVAQGFARVMERGAQVGSQFAYASGDTFEIKRSSRGAVQYRCADTLIRETTTEQVGQAALKAVLYTAGDAIYDPSIEALGGDAYGTLPALVGIATDGSDYGIAYGELLPLTGSAGVANKAYGTLPALIGIAADAAGYGIAYGELLPITGYAESGLLALQPAIAFGTLPLLTGSASGHISGAHGNASGELPALIGLAADTPYGIAYGELEPLWGYAYQDTAPTSAYVVSSVLNAGTFDSMMGLYVVMQDGLTVAGVLAAGLTLDARVFSSVQIEQDWTALAALQALIHSVVKGRNREFVFDDRTEVWVLNTENGGVTRYEDFPYNSFAKIDGEYYGCRPDGIYRLDADTEAGEPIQAMVNLGKLAFGTTAQKRVPNAYIGTSSGGKLYLKVRVGDQEYTYAARSSSEHLQTQRIDIGRGLQGNYIEFELHNEDGDDFDLQSVEFVVVPLSRRI